MQFSAKRDELLDVHEWPLFPSVRDRPIVAALVPRLDAPVTTIDGRVPPTGRQTLFTAAEG
ncbi:hypothetical protein SSOG_07844 [Streptomyces himastatinicus ATCC 53653]|uniref:Uncharacterized protein n=1 Tax=Streptomyces himastatinicus ATCC 53653 TaxID=457427 RepID=D9WQJ7_9ACTN|nr:hypothetical protein SSOG_07844 [Streptomyces himastatinicus ATCC 53653]